MLQRIFPEGLKATLGKGLNPFYLLAGSDLLLVDESKETIITLARKQDFDEKTEITINNETKWENIFEQAQSGGLFFSRQILILNLPENITATQQKNLAELLALSNPDLLFILHLPKLAKTMEKQAWFKQIEPNAVVITCQTPDISKMPTWLSYRAKAMNLQLDNEAIQLLCYSYEGNLLALKQVLQLLQLQYPEKKIGLNQAKNVVEQSYQFTPFQWIDALLLGKVSRSIRILRQLENEDVQAVVLLRILQKELMVLLEITRSPQPMHSSQPLNLGNLRAEFDRLKIWQNKRPIYQNAAQRLSYRKLFLLIQQLAEIEKKVKQEFSDEVWNDLEKLSLKFV